MGRFRWIVAAIIAISAASGSVGCSLPSGEEDEETAYRTAVATRRDISSSVLATGIVKPKVGAEVRVGSRISGIVKTLHANVGDLVREGDLIAELDSSELAAKHEEARAALETARADYAYARRDLERQQRLKESDVVSDDHLNLTEKLFHIARARQEQAEANLESARLQLGYTKLRAPIHGTVASVSTQEGETVAASLAAPTFVTIIDLNRLEVRAYVDETDIGRVRVGQGATFTVDTYRDIEFEGEVSAIYPQAEIQDNVVNYIAAIDIAESRGETLRPEMTTTVLIELESRKDVLAVPTSALQRGRDGMAVTIPGEKGPTRQLVETGWSSDGHTEIKAGLGEGDTVILH
ncbi:MAG: efflux RND transporter periplasmic adaptor subunit [Gemmatimonadota bacterium]